MLEVGTRFVTFTEHDLGESVAMTNKANIMIGDRTSETMSVVVGGGLGCKFNKHQPSGLYRIRTPGYMQVFLGSRWCLTDRDVGDHVTTLKFKKMGTGSVPRWRQAGELILPMEMVSSTGKVMRMSAWLPGDDMETFTTHGQLVVALASYKGRGEIGSNMRLVTMKSGTYWVSRPMPSLSTILENAGIAYADLCFYRMLPPSEHRAYGSIVFVRGGGIWT